MRIPIRCHVWRRKAWTRTAKHEVHTYNTISTYITHANAMRISAYAMHVRYIYNDDDDGHAWLARDVCAPLDHCIHCLGKCIPWTYAWCFAKTPKMKNTQRCLVLLSLSPAPPAALQQRSSSRCAPLRSPSAISNCSDSTALFAVDVSSSRCCRTDKLPTRTPLGTT